MTPYTSTLTELLFTCSQLASANGAAWQNLLNMSFEQEQLEAYSGVEIQTDRYLLVLSEDSEVDTAELYGSHLLKGGYHLLHVTPESPTQLAGLLALAASAVIVHEDLFQNPLWVLMAVLGAAQRGIPILTVANSYPLHPLLEVHVTERLETPSEVLPRLSLLNPRSKLPFRFDGRTAEGGFHCFPLFPWDFLSQSDPNSSRFALAQRRTLFLLGKAAAEGKLLVGKTYYACMYGDLCVSVEDESGVCLTTLFKNPQNV